MKFVRARREIISNAASRDGSGVLRSPRCELIVPRFVRVTGHTIQVPQSIHCRFREQATCLLNGICGVTEQDYKSNHRESRENRNLQALTCTSHCLLPGDRFRKGTPLSVRMVLLSHKKKSTCHSKCFSFCVPLVYGQDRGPRY